MKKTRKSLPITCLISCAIVIAAGLGTSVKLHSAGITRRATPSASANKRASAPVSRATANHTGRAPARNYGPMPLSFEANKGQAPPDFQFVAHGTDYALLLSPKAAVVSVEQQSDSDPYLAKLDAKTQRKLSHRKLYHALAQARGRHRRHNVRIQFDGANSYARSQPLDEFPGKTNYLVGNDRRKWLTGIPNYGRIQYSAIYSGVDLVYYGNQRQLEFDFVVSPGADPESIALKFDGHQHLSLASNGTLRLGSRRDRDAVLLHRPSIYQFEDGRKRTVQGGFVLLADRGVGVRVGAYDKSKPLIIDPVLAYSTYLSGSAGADVDGIAVDANGDAYVVGATPSTDFPVVNGYQSTGNANYVAFISKFDPTGTTLLYSTYLGGTGGDYGYGIALDPTGNVYVTGYSFSTDFPIVNGFQTTNNNTTYGNAFVARLDTTQTGAASLLYSSYLGGGGNSTNSTQGYGDLGFGIAADAYGFAYVTGVTTSDTSVTPFPTTPSAYQSSLASPNGNAFLTALDTNQSGSASLIYSTYLGGDGAGALIGDIGDSVAVDGFGDAYLAGQTTSNSSGPFPTTSSAYQSTLNSPNGNAFIAEISTTQSGAQSLVYSSYFGGSTTSIVGDWGENVALDATGKVYITGGADSSDFPVTSGAFQTTNSEGGKAFAAKFDLTQSGSQSLVYSTFLGGTNGSTGENGNGIAVDSNGDAYVVGCTSSSDFPTTSDAFQSTLKSSGVNAYLSKLNPAGTGLQYSTYLGGSSEFGDVATSVALDSLTNPYVAGYTDSSDFPILNAFQSSLNGGQSGFVTKFALNANPGITASPSPGPNSAGWNNSAVTVTFTCVPGAAPIQSCSAPVTVSTEGANQVVTGMAVDTANNTASATDTVSLDLTPPVLTIVSPANNATVSTPYVIISGTLTDSLSGPGYVSCNGVPAALTSTNFSCTVQLSSVSNSITVTGYDLAGNSSTTTLNVTVSMSAPTSLTVSPANPNMVVGGTQAFTAVDQTGTSRPDATWSVSDTTIASFVSGSPNSLTGNAAGTVTLTATVGSVTGQTTVTVLAGSSLSVGTVLWTAVPPSGYTTQQIVQAVPTANGPDLYSLSYDSNGDIAFQALKANGQQLWQNSIAAADTLDYLSAFPNYSIHGAGDNSGGLLLTVTPQSYAWDPGAALTPLEPNFITDVNPQTGQTSWTYSATGALNSSIAVGLDGTVYAVESDMTQNPPNPNNGGYGGTVYLDVINGSSGALVNQIELPTSLVTIPQNSCDETGVGPTELYPGEYGSPVVAPDGSVYLEVGASQVTADLCTYVDSVNWTVSLLRISPGGGPQFQTLQTYSEMLADYSQGGQVGDVIPDGQGGVLATWTQEYAWPGCSSNCGMTIADIGSNGTVMSQFSSINLGEQFLDSNLVLGDAGTAFITDSTNVVSFNVSNLQQNWIYSSTSGGYDLSLLAATRGGGTAVNDSDLGLIQLDSSGNPSQVTGAPGSTPTFSFSNLWDIPAASSGGVSQIALPVVVDGASFWASPTGGASANRASYPLNPTLLQTTADPPPTCPLCNLQSPACTTLTGSGSTYLIIMGDQGINTTTGTHDVGNLFKLAAQTSANDLQASGHRVIACRASSVQEFNNALTQHGLIDGGVIFFGHSGQTVYSGDSALYSSLFVGQEAGLYTNITAKTVGLLSNSELGANIEILLNGCTAGAPTPDGNPPIALIIAKQLQRPVAGYSQDMHFSNLDASHDLTIAGPTQNPSGLPMYMNPDGAPPRPQPIYFYP